MSNSKRKDVAKNRTLLLDAVGKQLSTKGAVRPNDVAAEAGLSRATLFRHFPTTDDLINAYIDRFLDRFEERVESTTSLEELSDHWCTLVAEEAYALVHVRSTEGFLSRAAAGDPIISRIHRIVKQIVEIDPKIMTTNHESADLAVFFWNALLDPRELLDLASHLGVPVKDVASVASAAAYAAIEAAS